MDREIVDIENWSANNPTSAPPPAPRYRIRIDKQHFVVEQASMTGEEILALVDKTPADATLAQKLRGGRREVIAGDQVVDLQTPGIERFETIDKQVQAGD